MSLEVSQLLQTQLPFVSVFHNLKALKAFSSEMRGPVFLLEKRLYISEPSTQIVEQQHRHAVGHNHGAWIKLDEMCNVDVPPDLCREEGSGLTFHHTSDFRGVTYRGVAFYRPHEAAIPRTAAAIQSAVHGAGRICLRGTGRDGSWEGDLDMTALAACYASQTPDKRGLVIIGGNYYDTGPEGGFVDIEIRVDYADLDTVFFRLFVML